MIVEKDSLNVYQTVKGSLPRLPFKDMKDEVLGKSYYLSLNFVGDRLSQKLNEQFRGKNYVPNVLSFPYSKNEGEIYINPHKTKKECAKYGNNFKEHVAFLFIHGLLHLKGMDHGSRMEKKEREVCRRFGINK